MSEEITKRNSEPWNETFLAIQKHWFDPSGKVPLSPAHEKILQRWLFADRLIRQNYMHEHDVPYKLIQEFGVSRATAFEDVRNAKRIFGKVSLEEQMYYSGVHYAYALEEFKKCQRRRDANGAAKFLKLMHEIKTQWDDGQKESMHELAKKVESMQVVVVVDDPSSVGLKKYTDAEKNKLLREISADNIQDAEYSEVKDGE